MIINLVIKDLEKRGYVFVDMRHLVSRAIDMIIQCKKTLSDLESTVNYQIIYGIDKDDYNEVPDLIFSFLWNFTFLWNLKAAFKQTGYREDVVKKIDDLDHLFKIKFYLFKYEYDKNKLKWWKKDLITTKHWMFTEIPPDAGPNDKMLPHLIQLGFNRLMKEKHQKHIEPELLAKYAFFDSDLEERTVIEKHVHSCGICLNEIIELRHIYRSTNEPDLNAPIPEKIQLIINQLTGG